MRDKKVEEIRKSALADAKQLLHRKDEELKELSNQLNAQQRRFDSVSSRQSKVRLLTLINECYLHVCEYLVGQRNAWKVRNRA